MPTTEFDFEPAYKAAGWGEGIAWRVTAYDTERVTDFETGDYEELRTGFVVAHMIGDDRDFTFDPDALTPIADEEYCSCCGQIGCAWG